MQQIIKDFIDQSFQDECLDNLERNELYELLDKLDGDQQRYLRNQAFGRLREQLSDTHPPKGNLLAMMKWLEKIVKSIDNHKQSQHIESKAYFSPGDDCRNAIIRLLGKAKQRVDICVFTISDNEITQAVEQAYKRGVPMRIVTDNDKANDRGSDVYALQQMGVPLCMDISSNHMHHKFALIDDQLINGSFNWTRSATERNEENIVVTNQKELVEQFESTFESLWKTFS
jgi:phosphatidylserine/phosphatidylglycerophosphate/cardiolipin synthase-like enzyme